MSDNLAAIEDPKKVPLIWDKLKVMFDDLKIPTRRRSPVEYLNCDCAKKSNTQNPVTAAETAVPAQTNDDPDALMEIDNDPGAKILPAQANGDDPDVRMANGGDPSGGIPEAPANGDDPDVRMANGDDPDAEIPPASANGDDPDVRMANGDDPDAEIPQAPANGEDPGAEIRAAAEVNGGDGGEGMVAAMREHIERMGGYQLQMIIEKVLTATDMRTDQGRLALPPKQLQGEFLTAEEERFLAYRGGDGEVENGSLNYIDTLIVGPDLRESPIRFKKWRIGARYANCLMNKWNHFAKTHGLKAGNNVQIWTFRVDRRDPETNIIKSELCFALLKP